VARPINCFDAVLSPVFIPLLFRYFKRITPVTARPTYEMTCASSGIFAAATASSIIMMANTTYDAISCRVHSILVVYSCEFIHKIIIYCSTMISSIFSSDCPSIFSHIFSTSFCLISSPNIALNASSAFFSSSAPM